MDRVEPGGVLLGFTYAVKMRAIIAGFTRFFIAGGRGQDHKVFDAQISLDLLGLRQMVYVQTINRQAVLFVVLVALLSLCLPLASRAQSIDRTDSAKSSPAEDDDDDTDTSESLNSGKGTTPGTDSSKAPVADPANSQSLNSGKGTTAGTDSSNAPVVDPANSQSLNSGKGTTAGSDSSNAPVVDPANSQSLNSGNGTTPGTESSNAPVVDPAKSQSLLDGLTAFKKRLDEAKAKGIGVASYASQCQRLEERIRSGESSDDLKASLDALNRGLKEQVEHVSPAPPAQPEAAHGETKGPSKSSSKYKAIVLCLVQGERQEGLVLHLAYWIDELVKQKKIQKNAVALVPVAMRAGLIRATSNASENAILARVARKLPSGDYFVSLAPQFAICDKDWNLKLVTSNVKQVPYFVADLVKQTGAPQKK